MRPGAEGVIKTETLKTLESIIGFDEMVKVIGMQAILHSTRITQDLLLHRSFHRDVCATFSNLLGEDKESAERALAGVLACEEYDQRVSLEGLGGCVVIPLDVLLNRGDQQHPKAPEGGRSLDDLRELWMTLGDVPIDSEYQLEQPSARWTPGGCTP